MSDDIVADLRSYTERFELSPRIQGKLMLEAADEIERLRVAVQAWALIAKHPTDQELRDEIERLRGGRDTMGNLWAKEKAENERLRERYDLRAKLLGEATDEIARLRTELMCTTINDARREQP